MLRWTRRRAFRAEDVFIHGTPNHPALMHDEPCRLLSPTQRIGIQLNPDVMR
jgi:hypothetical protein